MKQEEQKLVMEIMCFAFLVHEETKHCVWIDFSGHVDSLGIRISESKEKWQNKVCESQFYTQFKKYYDINDPLAFLKSRRDVLKEILETHDIPYDSMDEHIEHIRSYIF